MFAIVISEKGGAERREDFQQIELSIGRVQGNDLMLPKGNVSKRHARLMYRDGRFIVSDLNSTNGTYVNRRRISQATIVRQGDRIYIGDFVLRIEMPDDSSRSLMPDRPSVEPPPRAPMGTAPDVSRISRSPSRDSDAGGRYPPVPPAPRVPSPQLEAVPASGPEPIPLERAPSTREDSIDAETTAYRSAVRALVERAVADLDGRQLDRDVTDAVRGRVDQSIEKHLAALRGEGVIPAHIVEERLKTDVRAELLELGPIGPLLNDDAVSEIAVAGLHAIMATRSGTRTPVEPPFSTEQTLQRVLARLCRSSGQALRSDEGIVERQLPSGFWLYALSGVGVGGGALLRLARRQRVDVTLEDLVRAGTVSRAIATFLKHCTAARANILIVGPREARTASVLCALAAAPSDGHVVAIHARDVLVSSSVNMSHIELSETKIEAEKIIEFSASMPDARLAVEELSGPIALGTLEAIGAGADGVLASLRAHTIRRGLSRLPTELAAVRPGLTPATAREWVANSFDLVLELATLRDGRHRVLRVAEPVGVAEGEIRTRDIFTFIVERTASGGSVEGTFQASGAPPRLLDEMAARGIRIDSALFTRPPSR